MNLSKSMKKLVIIGGGFAGAFIAKRLESHFEVTLIDTKDYFEFTPSVLRTLVEPDHAKKIEVLHSQYLHKASIVRDEVIDITNSTVLTKHHSFPYDYLVLASGSSYNSPIKEKNLVIASRAKELQDNAQQLRKAQQVLIIGGGLVGTELAAEICTHYPEKKVTIVHAQLELIERNPSKARRYVRNFLEKRGVNIIFNERVMEHKDNMYITDKKRKIACDMAFLCTGIMPNYQYLRRHCSTKLTDTKSLCVNSYLQVEGHKNIFAAGDITNIKEEKTAQNAEQQAQIAVHNLLQQEKNKKLNEYRSQSRIMVISLGKWDGLLVYKNFVLTGVIPGILKTLIEWKTMQRYRK